MRHRMYDPKLGRFTQTDPILSNRPTEHYVYARSSPQSNIDPFGTRTWVLWNKAAKQVKVVTNIMVTSFDQPHAIKIAGRMQQGIEYGWNNGGGGWNIEFRDNDGDVHRAHLMFEARIVAVTADIAEVLRRAAVPVIASLQVLVISGRHYGAVLGEAPSLGRCQFDLDRVRDIPAHVGLEFENIF